MKLVDTHCHIQSIDYPNENNTRRLFDQLDKSSSDVIRDAAENNVDKLICVGCDIEDSIASVEFSKDKENIYSSIGIHPHEASNPKELNNIKKLSELAKEPKVVAIGECGLDYYYNHSKKEDQYRVLEKQIILAIENNLPLIFHCREAYDDFWPIFDSLNKNKKIKGVLHSFTDSQKNLEKALERDLFIGVNGIATFAKEENQINMYKHIPLNNMLLETDSPYLTPVPFRGRINEPKNVRTIAEFLANLRGEKVDQIANLTSLNANKLFNI